MFKKRTSIATSLFFILLVFSCVKNSVYAQESYWYGGVSIGEASIAEDTYNDSTPASFYIGKRYSESIAFEFGYLDLGGFESDSEESFDASADISGIEVSVLGLAKMGESVEFFGKAGLYIWEGDEVINGIDFEDSDISYLLGLGVNIPIGTTIGFRSEYVKYFDIGEEDADAINLGFYINF